MSEPVNDAIANMRRTVREFLMRQGMIDPPPPRDPRGYSLWLRDHQSTGPRKPHDGRRR